MKRFRTSVACCVVLLAVCVAPVFGQQANDDWISKEKIRAGWIYHGDGPDKLKVFRDLGMNALITHASEKFDEWALEAKKVPGMHLFGVLGFSGYAEKLGVRRAVFGNGYESVVPCPCDERFWQKQMIEPAVALARQGLTAEREISGILIDFELYANSGKGGQIYYTDACYCDHCFGGFLRHKGLDDVTKDVAFADRKKYLKDKGIDIVKEYQPFLQKQVRAIAAKMREEVEKVRKDFFLGFYPIAHNWMLVGTAQGLGSPDHPMILWATTTYGGGGAEKIADDWRKEMDEKEIHCYYCAGMLLRCYTSDNLAKNMFDISKKCFGYWLFTVHTLCIPEDRQSGDYYLASGTPDDYKREIQRANAELDKLCADANYQTDLKFVEEPVQYRHTGNDIHKFKPPKLTDKSTVERGKEMKVDPVWLVESQYLMMCLAEGEEAAVTLDTYKSKSKYVWGVSYSVIDSEKNVISDGKLVPGEKTTVKFKAPKAGLYTIVITPGHYGRCVVVSTTVPFALWPGSAASLKSRGRFEIGAPKATLYFSVPEGLKEFGIATWCKYGRGNAQLAVSAPDGTVVKDEATDPLVHSLTLTVPTGGKSGVWSLKIGPVPKKKTFRNVHLRFDKQLPQAVTVSLCSRTRNEPGAVDNTGKCGKMRMAFWPEF
ncbi:MAG: hypothetical protein GXP25_14760 [Planctomycetes bacterium]|nr:hypothetical protein [Planctomycetota bacterium]